MREGEVIVEASIAEPVDYLQLFGPPSIRLATGISVPLDWSKGAAFLAFLACRPGFYDPAVFEKNREVTVVGRVAGYENRRIGGYDYRFPRVEADVVYLWPVRETVDVVQYPAPWPWWGWW